MGRRSAGATDRYADWQCPPRSRVVRSPVVKYAGSADHRYPEYLDIRFIEHINEVKNFRMGKPDFDGDCRNRSRATLFFEQMHRTITMPDANANAKGRRK